MKQTKNLMIIKALIILLVLLTLTGCLLEDPNFDENERFILNTYSRPFQERATLQYGKDAKVIDIEAEILSGFDAVMPAVRASLSGNLLGTIQLGEERFEAMYLTEQDEIYSKRNADKIKQSAVQLFTDMGMDVAQIILEERFLPDSVVEIKGYLSTGENIAIRTIVKNNLSDFGVKDFEWLSEHGQDEHYHCLIFLQLNNLAELETIVKKWRNREMRVYPPNPRVRNIESDEYIDLFKYYDVESYIYLDKDPSKSWYFSFQNKDGVLIEDTIE